MRILLAEDDPMIGASVRQGLTQDGFTVDWVRDGRAAELALGERVHDALLLDLGLPRKAGLEVLAAMRRGGDTRPVLVITARDAVGDRIAGLDTGADDYLVKPFDPAELMARLRAVERRRSGGVSSVVTAGALMIDLGRMSVTREGESVVLTAKEWSLLRILASRLDRIHLKESLLEAMYGFNDEVASNTLEVFIHNLRRKLGPDSIQTVRGLGYRLTGSPT